MDASDIAAIASAVAAWLAGLFAFWSVRYSKRQLELAERSFLRRSPKLELYLATSTMEVDADERKYQLVISISNRSEADNSLARVELELVLNEGESVPLSTLRFRHDPTGADDQLQATERSTIPRALRPSETMSATFGFRVPLRLLTGGEVIRHTLVVTDAWGQETAMDIGTPTSVLDGKMA